jgi:hypothetical protein
MGDSKNPADYQQVVVDSDGSKDDSDDVDEDDNVDDSDGSNDNTDDSNEVAREYELYRSETTKQLFELFKETMELKEIISKKDKEIANLTEKIKTVKLVIGLKDTVAITTMDQNTEIKQIRVLIDQQSNRIQQFVSQLDAKDREIADLRSIIADKNKLIKEYKLDDLKKEMESLNEKNNRP